VFTSPLDYRLILFFWCLKDSDPETSDLDSDDLGEDDGHSDGDRVGLSQDNAEDEIKGDFE
jgi:hypothetical protein